MLISFHCKFTLNLFQGTLVRFVILLVFYWQATNKNVSFSF